ncbi:arginine--tRNA ligase [Chloroflexota bacterium]
MTEAAKKAQQKGKLPSVTLPEVFIERPQNPEHGDYASGFPMKLARAAGAKPMDIAEDLIALMEPGPEIESIVAAPPGFINFTLKNSWLTGQVDSILSAGESYGNIALGRGSRVQVEFVSINPTGPLHVGHGRGAVLGSTLANVLTASGYSAEKEYYFNNAGSQMDTFKRSLYTRYLRCLGKEAEIPSDGYHGNYLAEMAEEIIAEEGEKFLTLPEAEAISQIGRLGLDRIIKQIKEDLHMLGVDFDVWFTEQSLYDNGQYDKVMKLLREGGHIAENEGATWFVSTALGEDKDNVVVRSDGSPTYFATDIAYHYNKFLERKFDRVIDIWGADHQGHVTRLKAAVGALGIDPERLEMIIHQMVTLRRGSELVRVSKRSGDIITMREVVDEVGADACRFFFLSRSANSQMDFDLELAKKESADNPVYYVQYAHARIASILRLAKERKIAYADGDVSLLTTGPELILIRKLVLLPELVETIARTLEPHHLPYYAQDLATVFHSFYMHCRVVSKDEALTKARLKLVDAARTVLARTLHLMGMTAPDRM